MLLGYHHPHRRRLRGLGGVPRKSKPRSRQSEGRISGGIQSSLPPPGTQGRGGDVVIRGRVEEPLAVSGAVTISLGSGLPPPRRLTRDAGEQSTLRTGAAWPRFIHFYSVPRSSQLGV